MYKILALTGKSLSGKSSSKEIIQEIIKKKYPKLVFHNLSFAAKLKEIAFDLFEWDGEKDFFYAMTGDTKTPLPDMGRQLLINIGLLMRTIRPTVWADYICRHIEEDSEKDNKIYVIDDLRFKNEVLALQELTSSLVFIKVERAKAAKIDDISEIDLDDFEGFDFRINNNSSKTELYNKIDKMLGKVLK